MSDQYIGEIRMVPYAVRIPTGWLACEGQMLSTREPLFGVLGTTYGGNGITTFGLPDLRGRTPVGAFIPSDAHNTTPSAPSAGALGVKGGSETVALTAEHLPSHRHDFNAIVTVANEQLPASNLIASGATADQLLFAAPTNLVPLHSGTIANQGAAPNANGLGHDNMQPFQVIQYIIALQGAYPSRP